MGISADIFPRHSRILRNVFKTSNLRALPAIQTPFFHTSAIPALPLDASKVPDSPTIVGSQWTHLIRFVAGEDDTIHLGQIDPSVNKDVGLDVYNRKSVIAQLVKGSVFDGIVTDKTRTVKQVF
jgi:dihydroxyacetone synthase